MIFLLFWGIVALVVLLLIRLAVMRR